jgi:hypothetical protein
MKSPAGPAKKSGLTKGDWFEYVDICGWTLARVNARGRRRSYFGGYPGRNDTFDSALTKLATCYADQAESDYGTLMKAIRAGRLQAQDNVAA